MHTTKKQASTEGFHFLPAQPACRMQPGVKRCTACSHAVCVQYTPARLTQTISPFFDSTDVLFGNKYHHRV